MPKSCRGILNRMVFKGAMTEDERDKILRNMQPKWIPVTEKLPDKEGQYLVTTSIWGICDGNFKAMPCISLDLYKNGEWWSEDEAITAWMPLPKPYGAVSRR